MRDHKNYFRAAFDAVIEARTREAERIVAYYRANNGIDTQDMPKR